MASNVPPVIENAITLDGLAVYKQQSDQLYAGKSTATTTSDGLMSAADKAKLDSMSATLTESEVDAAVAAAFAS